MSIIEKVIERVQKRGLKAGAKQILVDASSRVVDANREVVLLRLDLSNPKAHRTKKEIEKFDFRLDPFGPNNVDDVIAMLRTSEPTRIDQVKMRIDAGTPGFVAYESDRIFGYVFYVDGSRGPRPYSDLEWLGIDLRDKEVYSFDSFIPVELRGRGIPMYRASYQRLFELGYTTAYGYVWAWDKAPRWSYRLTGWEEFGRFTEHRIAGRFAIVGGVLYKLNRFNRDRLAKIPFGDRLHPT